MLSKKTFGIIASVLAATLAVGAAAIVRARTVSPGGAPADASAAISGAPVPGIPTPSTNANALGRLLVVSPDGTGTGLPMYSASGTVATSYSSWIKSKYPNQVSATQTSDPATKYWALLIGLND